MPTHFPRRSRVAPVLICMPAVLLSACQGPIRTSAEADLRRAVSESVRRELVAAEHNAGAVTTAREDRLSELEIEQRHLDQIDREYNPANYPDLDSAPPEIIGEALNLFGQPQETAGISLRRAVGEAIRHNLVLESARVGPAIREAELVQALAEFDWAFFGELGWTDTDTPRTGIGSEAVDSAQAIAGGVGLRRNLESGGSFQVRQDLIYTDVRDQALFGVLEPDPSYLASLALELNQPLLRGAGSDVTLASVRIARNLERDEIEALRGTLIDTITAVEDAYWDLVVANRRLVILQQLLTRGVKVRDDIRIRRILDAKQAQIADAVSRVERRRADVIRARVDVRRASDRLKQLMNAPDLPVTGEVLLVPVDAAIDEPIEYDLLDSILAAIENRPDLRRSAITIDTASIREQVAANGRLPRLDFQAQLGIDGLDRDADDAFSDSYDGEFINDFFLGLRFEQPIGNRGPEAAYRGSRLERMQSVIDYRRTVQNAIVEVKAALDDVVTNYRLISQARVSRIAAGEVLRALGVEKELTDAGYTVERLNVELNNQESLAQAELEEIRALVDYNRALARLHQSTGTALARNRVDFVVPDANQLLTGERAAEYPIAGD